VNPDALLRRSVIGVGPYVPGAGARELKARTGRTDLIRLNWNENLLGPLDGVLDAIGGSLPDVVLRTFSKIFGLAGLRLGYLLVPESLAPHLHAVQEPFNVNCAALAAGLASLERVDALPARRRQAVSARARLVEPLASAGIRTVESHASFVLVEVGGDDVAVCEALAREGLLLRAGSEFGLPGYVRVTIADEQLMDRVGGALAAALA
jgi:histidinol-phosphate aminotransferase